MANELTLEILDEAIAQLNQLKYDNEIIGVKLNPADYRAIKDKLASIFVITNNKLIWQPPYQGLIIEQDVNVPPGYPEPIRRCKKS